MIELAKDQSGCGGSSYPSCSVMHHITRGHNVVIGNLGSRRVPGKLRHCKSLTHCPQWIPPTSRIRFSRVLVSRDRRSISAFKAKHQLSLSSLLLALRIRTLRLPPRVGILAIFSTVAGLLAFAGSTLGGKPAV